LSTDQEEKKMPYVLALLLLVGGCAQTPIKEEVKEMEQVATGPAKEDFKEYMQLNFGGTSWYENMKSFDLKVQDGKVVLGIVTKNPEDYKDIEMPATLWIDNDAPIQVNELWFICDGALVTERSF
jgi:hypothetical protein